MFPRAAATWHGLSPCLALMVGERSVNLSNHLREPDDGERPCIQKGGGADTAQLASYTHEHYINSKILSTNAVFPTQPSNDTLFVDTY